MAMAYGDSSLNAAGGVRPVREPCTVGQRAGRLNAADRYLLVAAKYNEYRILGCIRGRGRAKKSVLSSGSSLFQMVSTLFSEQLQVRDGF